MESTVAQNAIGDQMESRGKIEIWTDGGSRGNPGAAAIGVVIRKNDKVEAEFGRRIGVATNNVAEYTAVLEALTYTVEKLNFDEVNFFLDSELVVRQLNGIYKVKDQNLKQIFFKVRHVVNESGAKVTFTHITREKNKRADELVNDALDLNES